MTREEIDARKATSGRPSDPHSKRQKVAARAPRTPDDIDKKRIGNSPSANELRPIEITYPFGGGFKSVAEAWQIDDLLHLHKQIVALLTLQSRGIAPSHAAAKGILPEMQDFMGKLQSLVSNVPDPTTPAVADVMPKAVVVEKLCAMLPGARITAADLVRVATNRFITTRHQDFADYLQRLYEWRSDLIVAVAEADPGLRLDVLTREVTIGFDYKTNKPEKRDMPVYCVAWADDESVPASESLERDSGAVDEESGEADSDDAATGAA